MDCFPVIEPKLKDPCHLNQQNSFHLYAKYNTVKLHHLIQEQISHINSLNSPQMPMKKKLTSNSCEHIEENMILSFFSFFLRCLQSWVKFFKSSHSKLSFGFFPVIWIFPRASWKALQLADLFEKTVFLNICIYPCDNLELEQSKSFLISFLLVFSS